MADTAADVPGVVISIPGWRSEPFAVSMSMFSSEHLIEIALAEEPLYFSGLVDLDAGSPLALGLRICDLVDTPVGAEDKMWLD